MHKGELRKFRFAFIAEQFSKVILENIFGETAEHLTANNDQAPYDLEISGTKVDVKYSSPTLSGKAKKQKTWDFCIRDKQPVCDYYCLVGAVNGTFTAVFFVPTKNAPSHHIRISIEGNSKWHKYLIWGD